MTGRRKPSPAALAAAAAWQAPAPMADRRTVEIENRDVIELDRFNSETLRLRIAESGEVGRWLPTCRLHVPVLADGYRPLTATLPATADQAAALIEQVRALAGMNDRRNEEDEA